MDKEIIKLIEAGMQALAINDYAPRNSLLKAIDKVKEYASLSQPSKDVESAAKEWANSGSYKAWLNDGMDRSHYGSTIRSFKAGAEWAASHQPQCQMRWRSGKDLPPIDDSDFPIKYVCRFKGDDPRSGWVDVAIMTAAEMKEENYDEYWEWLDESLSSSPAEDKVAYTMEMQPDGSQKVIVDEQPSDKVQGLVFALEQIAILNEHFNGNSMNQQSTSIATAALNKFKTP